MNGEPTSPQGSLNGGPGAGLLGKIWRRRRLFIWTFVALFGAVVASLLILPVRYLATGSVIVAEQEPAVENNAQAWVEKVGDPADLESQLLVVRSPRVIRLALKSQGVYDAVLQECRNRWNSPLLGWLGERLSPSSCNKLKPDSEALLEYVQGGYTAAAVGRSRVFNISYLSSLPDVAQTMADALINTFLEEQRTNASSGRHMAADWLWEEIRQLDKQIRDEDAKIQKFRGEKGLTRGTYAPISSERLTSIGLQLSAAETARTNAEARWREIKADQTYGTSNSPAVLASRPIADLKQQIAVTTAELGNASGIYGRNHPTIHSFQHQLSDLQHRLNKEVDSIANSAKNNLATAESQVTALRRELETAKAEVASATADESSIENMVRDVEIKRRQYSELYKKASELETDRRVLQGGTRLVSFAELPTRPYFPKTAPFLAAGFVLALFGAFGAVIWRERSDHTVRIAQDLAVIPGLSTIIGLPSLRAPAVRRFFSAGHVEPSLRTALQRGRSDRDLQDRLRKLYAAIMLGDAGRMSRRILITSPGPKEGKTFTTLALARFAAATGRRVIAIECDMRSPSFEAALNIKGSLGLADVLRGKVPARDAVIKTANPDLDVIVAGAPTIESTELLMSHHLSELSLWVQSYDLVLIDSPACNGVMDALVLAQRVDGVLCCMRWGHSDVADAATTVTRLRTYGANVLGMVITMISDADQSGYEGALSTLALYLKAS
jgi:capsular exopolysaccharide synthesis family protein